MIEVGDFQVGQRVVISKAGLRHFAHSGKRFFTGTVIGACRSPVLIKIRVDGYKTVKTFAKIFWKAG